MHFLSVFTLLQYLLGTMALSQSRDDRLGVTHFQSLVNSLNLKGSMAVEIMTILKGKLEITSIVENKSNITNQDTHLLVKVFCTSLKLIFGPAALIDETSIQQAVSDRLIVLNRSQTCWQILTCDVRLETPKQVSQVIRIVAFLRMPFSLSYRCFLPPLNL